MPSTQSAYNLTRIVQGAGTTLVSATPCVFHSIFIPATVAGTSDFYDSATKAGTSASNLILGTLVNAAGTPAGATGPVVFDWNLKNGLVVVTAGTVNLNISTG